MERALATVPRTLPNALTLGRILLVPVLVALILAEPGRGSLIAAAVFAAGVVTDCLDGYLARSRSLVSTFGTVMDPIADKLMVGAALACLVAVDRLAVWVALVIVVREAAVSGLRAFAGRDGLVIPARPLGKAKMGVQAVAVLALLAATDPAAAWLQGLLYATVAITVLSGVEYFVGYRRGLGAAAAAR